jgi:hypothetical protein
MAESVIHLRLVATLVAHITTTYSGLVVFHDLPAMLGAEKPPRIGGYVPDVYATDAPTTITVVGEAKTEADLTTDHSRGQLIAFLQYLGARERGVLVLAVPWGVRATAKNLLVGLQREYRCDHVVTAVLDLVEAPCSR